MAEPTKTLALAAGLGLVAGMRSMTAPAVLSHYLSRWGVHSDDPTVRLLASPRTAGVLKVLAAGELVADKTPFIPSRTEPAPLLGRVFMGALCGSVVGAWRGSSQPAAAFTGAVAALGGTYLAYQLRKRAGHRTGLPDSVFAVTEDAVALAAGAHLAAAAVAP
jgi:uncharacterized membrane protein